jgi:hypothetical protein
MINLPLMPDPKLASFSYYFLNKRLHPPAPAGFRVDIVLLIINKNPGNNLDKYLFIKEETNGYSSWGLPKEGLQTSILADDVFTAIARNIESELGFRGLKISESKPSFVQRAI